MSQSASLDKPELFADRPDIPSVSDVLSTVLRTVRLSGQDVTEVVAEPPTEWTQPDDVGAVHLVENGEVHLEGIETTTPRALRGGDVALLPAARPHLLKVTEPGTRWLTGTFVFDGATGNRLLAELPPVIAFKGLRERGYEWFDVSYRMIARERRDPTPGAAVMISRILDLMYIQMLRVWATSAEGSPGWLRAGMDPDIGRVLDAIHADPARAWSCATMAQHAHLSRTTFTERFSRLLGQPPMTYVTELRMELARDLLLGSTDAAKQIARRIGYASDAAFNRAFTKHHGRSPAQWRHEHINR
ncbi:MAG TPA: AraC family transcriptional regulator [Mycobacterium sp.]|nr:AraC family transcriptional regulator [Mycobacterium sp.]